MALYVGSHYKLLYLIERWNQALTELRADVV